MYNASRAGTRPGDIRRVCPTGQTARLRDALSRGLSPPRYNVVHVGCRLPRAVPPAFGVSAQFDGLAQMSVALFADVPSVVPHAQRDQSACRSQLGGLPAVLAPETFTEPSPRPTSKAPLSVRASSVEISSRHRASNAVGRAQGSFSQGSGFEPGLFHKAYYMPFYSIWS